ncbi:UDP-2,3-diacylglucosamine diphosphatase LpxI [Chelatococcus sp. SYSU_G07232]|uniref:UDP-2,3-diacylglucosamine diphosphatase LpxI n=1 Tax=Chelatococcus albus TaxID=3047466 RepID=A0ABT7ABM7_9HYPH|nr:UDP-2,3-diacylglucosamine diphosphatase LpxI [Chelatococcus sp. SYSU_G07232]MDJ1156780.1 UDP-2,3-diacylglucosamine diphosphatase LpxI [Chelatococcus sp. SYSU_G07232]
MAAASHGPVVILAGGGALPERLARALQGRGREVRIIAFRGFTAWRLSRRADAVVDLLDIRRALNLLASWSPAEVVLAGPVQRPGPAAALGALASFRNRDEIASLLASGDDRLLTSVIRLIEEQGHRVSGIDGLAPELLAPAGVMSTVTPDDEQRQSMALGFSLLGSLSPFDVGQAAVIAGRRVAAIEGPEGTDAMLKRVRRLWGTRRLPKSHHGMVLVKTAKEGQDLRVDLPAIGPRTVIRAAAAGVNGIAVGAGRTLVIDPEETLQEAERRRLFLVGVSPRGAA